MQSHPSESHVIEPFRRAVRALAASTLCAGAVVAGLVALGGPAVGAANPTPSFVVADYGASKAFTFPMSANGNVAPAITNSSTGLAAPTGITLDAAGDLWVANDSAPTVVMYTASQLASSGSPTPAVTINTGNLPSAVALDAAGNLWVSNFNTAPGIEEYTKSQIQTSGSPTPAVSLSGSSTYAWGLTFDGAGNLWTGGYSSGGGLNEFTKSQLATSGSPTPAVTIAGIADPVMPTFDAQGDLWVSENTGTPAVDEFTPSQLTTSGSPTPAVQLTGGGLNRPAGLEFDTSGNLWVANFAAPSVSEYTKGQLTATGSPTPAATIAGTNTGFVEPAQLALSEAPVVTSVTPAAGPSGTVVTISGAGFLVGSSVSFGTTPATSVTYVSPYELQATAPAGAGTVDVTVSTSGGTSATSAADQFTLSGGGYWEVASDGGIFNYGTPFFGSQGGKHLNAPVVGIAGDPATGGYWEVAADGGVFGFNAPYLGGRGGQPLNAPIVGMAATKDGGGYWLVAKDGGIFNYGDAAFAGSMGGKHLNSPVVGIAADSATGGYWEVAGDGGIFNFNAPFLGSRGGQPLNAPVVGIAAGANGAGYWLVAKDGGIFNYGTPFLGSRGGQPLNAPVVGIATDVASGGYWEIASDGGIFNYGAPFLGGPRRPAAQCAGGGYRRRLNRDLFMPKSTWAAQVSEHYPPRWKVNIFSGSMRAARASALSSHSSNAGPCLGRYTSSMARRSSAHAGSSIG